MERAPSPSDRLARLVRVAVHSDDPRRLLAAASAEAGEPLALAGPHGEAFGCAPDGSEGRRALAVARAAARNRLAGAAGWSIVPIARNGSALGFLAIGAARDGAQRASGVLAVLPELVADQLHRALLLRRQRSAFVRRLVSDPGFEEAEVRREAEAIGVDLADAYWPAILAWHGSAPPLPVVERVAREALRHEDGSLVALHERRVVVLQLVRDGGASPHARLERIVERARRLAPSFPVQAITADGAVELAHVSAEVAELDELRRLGPLAADDAPVVSPRELALERLLLDHVGRAGLRRFVEQQLAPLLRWDGERRADLLSVLEAALDFPRHDHAARRCYMHRNTFRHRLQQAEAVLGARLEDPDVRLAVHVALRLRRLALPGPAAARDGAAREGAARDGAARDGAARDGAAREGAAARLPARRPDGI